jgi:hypothetical protein
MRQMMNLLVLALIAGGLLIAFAMSGLRRDHRTFAHLG